MDKIRIGIQFNFDPPHDNISVKQTRLFTALDMKSDGWHIDTYFKKKELKRFDPKKAEPEKLSMMKRLIKRYAPYSSYTNIYTLIEAGRLSNVKSDLLETDFQEDCIRITPTNKKDLLSNLNTKITNPSFIKFLKRSSVVKIMNSLYLEVANREVALEQKMTIDIDYEDGGNEFDSDTINIGIQLEMPEKMNTPSIPSYDFFEKNEDSDLEEVVESFIFSLEETYFEMWDAVVSQEENKSLTTYQKELLEQLINFGTPDAEKILYIDGMHRPKDAWHVTANKIAKKLVLKLKSEEIYSEMVTEGWPRIKDAIMEKGLQLPKPKGVKQAIHLIPEPVRHQLEIQTAMDWLLGLGQEPELTLADKEQDYRVEELIEELGTKLESVRYFDLSLHKICSDFIELPKKDEQIFKQDMMKRLGLLDEHEPIVEKLVTMK